jgi:hypothetical protein
MIYGISRIQINEDCPLAYKPWVHTHWLPVVAPSYPCWWSMWAMWIDGTCGSISLYSTPLQGLCGAWWNNTSLIGYAGKIFSMPSCGSLIFFEESKTSATDFSVTCWHIWKAHNDAKNNKRILHHLRVLLGVQPVGYLLLLYRGRTSKGAHANGVANMKSHKGTSPRISENLAYKASVWLGLCLLCNLPKYGTGTQPPI